LNDRNQNFESKEERLDFQSLNKSKKAAGMAPGGLQDCK
jgi:hypothetical protein